MTEQRPTQSGPPRESTTVRAALRTWARPPRAHGEVIEDRTVSFLELFYDLIYVVLISQISHTLAADVSWGGVGRFAVVFVLVWFAWVNGTLYHDLHGGEDGRSRTFIFIQMAVLAILATYASHAGDDLDDGRGFAITYAILLAVLVVQWMQVRRQDTGAARIGATQYLVSTVVVAVVVAASALVDDSDGRLWIWAAAMAGMAVLIVVQAARGDVATTSIEVSDSMAERFHLFTIIVLGEVVVGVVDGIAETDRSARTIFTGVVALTVGFAVWWNHFDLVGRALPRPGAMLRIAWSYAHLPLTFGIAALGAAMVGLVEHAPDNRTPEPTAWLVGGSLAIALLSMTAVARTLPDHPGTRLVPWTLTAGAALALVLAALRPAPWLLALALFVTLSGIWWEAFVRHARAGYPIAGP